MNERWVLREGKIKGQGKYLGPGLDLNLQEDRAKAHVFPFEPDSGCFGIVDRPVKLVPKKAKPAPKVEIRDGDSLYINGDYIAIQAPSDPLHSIPDVLELAERLRKALGVK